MSSNDINSTKIRIDYSRNDQYIYPEPYKLSFGQKVGRFFGRAMNVLGPIGAAVSAIALPGIGIPIAAGLYGLTRASQMGLASSYAKQQAAIASTPMPNNIQMPGFFVPSGDAGEHATEFIAPRSLEPNIGDTIILREQSRRAAEVNF